MDSFLVSARKYRPKRFDDVVGQGAITQTLKNAILSGQLAHAYLFCGPRGVGKTTCARIFSQTINCLNLLPTGDPCNQCESCKAFQSGNSLNIYELDAASKNSVDDIRALVDQIQFAPHLGKYKVYIIDEVHMLSQAAFNAFLKTLEEPPPYAKFILATTEKHKILPTILSRCQVFTFQRVQTDDIVKYLEYICKNENVEYEKEALYLIAQKSDGGLRDACSILDQQIAFGKGRLMHSEVAENLHILDESLMFDFSAWIFSGDFKKALLELDTLCKRGFDLHIFISSLSGHLRNILLASDMVTQPLIETSDELRAKYAERARSISPGLVIQMIQTLSRADVQFRNARNPRLFTESVLIQLCRIPSVIEEKKNSLTQPAEKLTSLASLSVPSEIKSNTRTGEPPVISIDKEQIKKIIHPGKTISDIVHNIQQVKLPDYILSETKPVSSSVSDKEPAQPLVQPPQPDIGTVQNIIHDFAEKISVQRKMLSIALKNSIIQIRGNSVVLQFQNESNVVAFEEYRLPLMEHLVQTGISCSGLIAEVIPDSETSNKQNYLAPSERYKEIIEQKPWIEEFRKKFNLRLEF